MANEHTTDAPDRPEPPADPTAPEAHRRRTWWKWAAGVVVALAVLAVVGPYVYINFILGDPPEQLSLDRAGTGTTVSEPAFLDGDWQVGSGSSAGYRVDEILIGQSTTAVGRTNDVTGRFTLDGSTVSNGSFVVNMASVSSDHGTRDTVFRLLLDTSSQPTATFVTTAPIELDSVPAEGKVTSVTTVGNLTLKGVTKSVEIPLQVRRTGGTVDVLGSLALRFGDYGIANPSIGPAQVGDLGTLEFLLRFAKTGDTTTTIVPATTLPQGWEGPLAVPSTTQPPLGL